MTTRMELSRRIYQNNIPVVRGIEALGPLLGQEVEKVSMNEDFLRFDFYDEDRPPLTLSTEADCCSNSVFHDFYGVEHILAPFSRIAGIYEVPLDDFELKNCKDDNRVVTVYGYKIYTNRDYYTDEIQGADQHTSVFSFRNYSNGWYGGNLLSVPEGENVGDIPEITKDVHELR